MVMGQTPTKQSYSSLPVVSVKVRQVSNIAAPDANVAGCLEIQVAVQRLSQLMALALDLFCR
jgi:hypothetical protein